MKIRYDAFSEAEPKPEDRLTGKKLGEVSFLTAITDVLPQIRANINAYDNGTLQGIVECGYEKPLAGRQGSDRKDLELKCMINTVLEPAYNKLKNWKIKIDAGYWERVRSQHDAFQTLEDRAREENGVDWQEGELEWHEYETPEEDQRFVECGQPFDPFYLRNGSDYVEKTRAIRRIERAAEFMGEPFTSLLKEMPPNHHLVRDILSRLDVGYRRIHKQSLFKGIEPDKEEPLDGITVRILNNAQERQERIDYADIPDWFFE